MDQALTKKPFTFGHPSIESIANRFLNKNIPVIDNTHAFIEAHYMTQRYLLNRSQVGQILTVGGKLLLINLTQGSFTNDTPIFQNFSTCSISLRARKLQSHLQWLLQQVLLKMPLLLDTAMVTNNSKQVKLFLTT
ncbi:hypothetical protein J1N35_029801 [Gossypium stocksii]|uniref:Uncharacterized protein n=1 Tax=Gossypium stocksii TaxID=47602 RepID=A0A9D3UZL8_9ROSI|nr:hypothetical protein J1N35_029801 [Gossypium stocksii]